MSSISGISRSYAQEYWLRLPRGGKATISKAAGISRVHAWAVFNNKWQAAPQTAMNISEATGGQVSPEQLIPDSQVLRLGIDPGVNTGYAVIDRQRYKVVLLGTLPAASRPIFGKGKWFDIEGFNTVLNMAPDGPMIAFVETPALMPGKGVKTTAMQFETFGVIRTILHERKIPITWVAPAWWKRKAGLLKKDKDASVQLAKTLYPGDHLNITHDAAESILIAHFGI